jgi:hypothetical protein
MLHVRVGAEFERKEPGGGPEGLDRLEEPRAPRCELFAVQERGGSHQEGESPDPSRASLGP